MKKSDYKHLVGAYENKTDFYEAPDGMPFLSLDTAMAYAKENKLNPEDCRAILSESDCEEDEPSAKTAPAKAPAAPKAPAAAKAPAAPKAKDTGKALKDEKKEDEASTDAGATGEQSPSAEADTDQSAE